MSEGAPRRPWPITAWAVIFTLGAIKTGIDVGYAYGVAHANYFELNPGPFAIFRPIAWVSAFLVPFGFWFMRRWAVGLVILVNLVATALIFIVQPDWMSQYPGWFMPARLVLFGVFLLTVLPYWSDLSRRIP